MNTQVGDRAPVAECSRAGPQRARWWVLFHAATLALTTALTCSAQTRFAWPTRAPAYDEYDLEQCSAAVRRVRQQAAWGSRPDTVPVPVLRRAPEPLVVVNTARLCVSHDTAGAVGGTAYRTYMDLLLNGDLDSVYSRTIHDRLRKATSSEDKTRQIADAVLSLMQGRQPPRFALADALAEQLDTLAPSDREARANAFSGLLETAIELDDSAIVRRERSRTLSALNAMAADVVSNPEMSGLLALEMGYLSGAAQVVMGESVLRVQGPEAYLDSLRHAISTAVRHQGYAGTLVDSLANMGLHGGGALAPAVKAAFWFGRIDTSAAYPRKGVISLITFADQRCGENCYYAYNAVRRLKQRFGQAVEVILVTPTAGYFRQRPPLEPAAEAEVLRWYFLDFLRLPVVLAVVNTDFQTAPAPDRRRFYEEPLLYRTYGVSGVLDGHSTCVLVTRDGLILYRGDVVNDGVLMTHLVADLVAFYAAHN